MAKSTRSDSSASLLQSPSSPIPTSVEAIQPSSISSHMQSSSPKANGGPAPPRESFGVRARSASLLKGVAVLKALARAPEGASEEDSGYEDEAGEHVGRVPGVAARGDAIELSDASNVLSEEAKQSGRANRDGLRKRNEDREVEKIVGARTHGNGNLDRTGGKKKEKRSRKIDEIPRKIFHSSMGFMVLYLYLWYIDLHVIVRNLSIFLGIVVTADVLRLNLPAFESVYEMVLGFLMRESEKKKVNGVVWYLIGVLTCLRFFPSDIACVSVMILSWADTSASVFGKLYGAWTPPLPSPPFAARKSTAGFLAAIVAATLTAALFWGSPIAQMGKRLEGLSTQDDFGRAVFGTSYAMGPLGSGWTGSKWGFRPSHPDIFLAPDTLGVLTAVKDSIKLAANAALTGSALVRPIPLPVLCVGTGLVAGIAEGLELGGVDDNLSLPILTAIGIQGLLIGWGWFASYFLYSV